MKWVGQQLKSMLTLPPSKFIVGEDRRHNLWIVLHNNNNNTNNKYNTNHFIYYIIFSFCIIIVVLCCVVLCLLFFLLNDGQLLPSLHCAIHCAIPTETAIRGKILHIIYINCCTGTHPKSFHLKSTEYLVITVRRSKKYAWPFRHKSSTTKLTKSKKYKEKEKETLQHVFVRRSIAAPARGQTEFACPWWRVKLVVLHRPPRQEARCK